METAMTDAAGMTPEQTLREQLAAYAHDAWSGWLRYMFTKCEPQSDGTLVIPAWAVKRWTRQLSTSYNSLPESEKDSDRTEANRMLAIVDPTLAIVTAERNALRAERRSVEDAIEDYSPARFKIILAERVRIAIENERDRAIAAEAERDALRHQAKRYRAALAALADTDDDTNNAS
jgi:hypothetical protein